MLSKTWNGCYDGSLKDLIVPEAFSHPAKMSRKLCERIFDYGFEKGYWKPGDIICDPFGGIGTTGLIGAYRGYPTISVELEERFINLARENIEYNRQKLERLKSPLPIIIQGDSREIKSIVDNAIGVITSPPWGSIVTDGGWQLLGKYAEEGKLNVKQVKGNPNKSYPSWSKDRDTSYGDSEGQLGVLPEGDQSPVVGAITSPPWENNLSADRVDPDQRRAHAREQGESNAENISPIDMEKIGKREQEYGETAGQLANLPTGAITSPPYEDSVNSRGHGIDLDKLTPDYPGRVFHNKRKAQIDKRHKNYNYGASSQQIGNQKGDTYWSAVAQIYQQVYELLPPGGAFAVVIKDFVRNKQRVPLCDQTAELLSTIGFDIPERIRAMLVKEIQQPTNMFTGENKPRLVERKSFFRRLAEKKGSPRIDWEEVIWAVKPTGK